MKKVKNFVAVLITVLLIWIFIILSFGLNVNLLEIALFKFIQPVIFAVAAAICIFFTFLRKYLLMVSLALLIFMILTYLFNLFDFANWTGSLGFGILTIVVFSYIPQLIKKGYIEKY